MKLDYVSNFLSRNNEIVTRWRSIKLPEIFHTNGIQIIMGFNFNNY